MTTTYYLVPAGTVSPNIAITPQFSVTAGPSVLGGSVTVEFATSQQGPWATAYTGLTGGSYRPIVNGYVRITAVTNSVNAFVSDIGLGAGGLVDTLIQLNAPLASPNITTAAYLAGFRIPPGYLSPNFRLEISGTLSVTNSATVKTLNIYANGIAGTALATSPSLASIANYTFNTEVSGRGDGVTIMGTGMLASETAAQGGYGSSTTTIPTITYNYLTQETEFVVGVTKATGTDTAQLETLRVTIYV